MEKLTYIDLFAGAGGLSEGFINAGFTPVAHVEVDSHACETLRTRNIYHTLRTNKQLEFYYDYLKGILSKTELEARINPCRNVINASIGEDNYSIFRKIDSLSETKGIDLIIGGPPCQAYSMIGRYRINKLENDDPRNLLYKEYGKFLSYYKPKIFVFENVLGLISAEKGKYFNNLKNYFNKIGYNLECQVQNAAHFGVLQNRKRIIIIGWRKELNLSYPNLDKVEHNFTIKDVLGDLKRLTPGEENNITKYKTISNDYLTRFGIREFSEADFVTQHIARPHNEKDLGIYKIAIDKWLNKKERLRYPDLPNHLKTHKNETSFIDRFKVVDINGFSHTMVAHIAKDGHHYIYPDKRQVRSLSVREAARIQSFPDNYYFEGGRSAAFKQIGNAVPPLLANKIAESIRELLNEYYVE